MLSNAWNDRLVRSGIATLVVGCGPLAACLLIDPKANPILPGMLAGVTFWPGAIMLIVGAVRSLSKAKTTTDREQNAGA